MQATQEKINWKVPFRDYITSNHLEEKNEYAAKKRNITEDKPIFPFKFSPKHSQLVWLNYTHKKKVLKEKENNK